MAIGRIQLRNFRNHAQFDLSVDASTVVVAGPNGAGKTNLLEALSLLVPGRGIRGAPLADLAMTDGDGSFTIFAESDGARLGVGTEANEPNRRQTRINGARRPTGELSEWLSMVWLTPAMDRLFVEAPSGRRRFLDRLALALAPAHGHHANRYDQALRERNRLMSDEATPDPAWLDGLEAIMAEHGAAMNASRLRLVQELGRFVSEAATAPFPAPALSLEPGGDASSEALADRWRAERQRDRAAGRTLSGPHRADLIVSHMEKGVAAANCSTGEQKALLLSIILAHADLVASEREKPPVLLLDELAAHLDAERRDMLLERISDSGQQVWITGTEAETFAAARNAQTVRMS